MGRKKTAAAAAAAEVGAGQEVLCLPLRTGPDGEDADVEGVKQGIVEALEDVGFAVQLCEQEAEGKGKGQMAEEEAVWFLMLSARSPEVLDAHAERLGMCKKDRRGFCLRKFTVANKKEFLTPEWTPAEAQIVLYAMLEEVHLRGHLPEAYGLPLEEDRNHRHGNNDKLLHLLQGGTNTQLLRPLPVLSAAVSHQSKGAASSASASASKGGAADDGSDADDDDEDAPLAFPIHTDGGAIARSVWDKSKWCILVPVQEIADYFGTELALYFAWMNFYVTMLCLPAPLGVLVYMNKKLAGLTADDDTLSAIFALFVIVPFGICFYRFWLRSEAAWACRWGTLEVDLKEQVRPSFHGRRETNPLTGQEEMRYPYSRRLAAYALSAVVTLLMLGVAVVVMTMSLNAQGYIDKDGHAVEQFFHVGWLSALSEPGAVFDARHMVFSLIPVVLHVTVILGLNFVYRHVAEALTKNENHRTLAEHMDSVVLKRVAFELLDCMLPLAFLAFIAQDVRRLRGELISVFLADTFRRIATETVLPAALRFLKHRQQQQQQQQQQRHNAQEATTMSYDAVKDEFELDDPEPFDEYVEIVVQLGYVILFAAAFPLASVVALVANIVESKNDLYDLVFLSRRKLPARESSIGIWNSIICALGFVAILTNCLIAGLASEQLVVLWPSLFQEEDGDQVFVAGAGRIVIGAIFVGEHCFVLAALLLQAAIPATPGWVADQLAVRRAVGEQGVFLEPMNPADAEHDTDSDATTDTTQRGGQGRMRKRRRSAPLHRKNR